MRIWKKERKMYNQTKRSKEEMKRPIARTSKYIRNARATCERMYSVHSLHTSLVSYHQFYTLITVNLTFLGNFKLSADCRDKNFSVENLTIIIQLAPITFIFSFLSLLSVLCHEPYHAGISQVLLSTVPDRILPHPFGRRR